MFSFGKFFQSICYVVVALLVFSHLYVVVGDNIRHAVVVISGLGCSLIFVFFCLCRFLLLLLLFVDWKVCLID